MAVVPLPTRAMCSASVMLETGFLFLLSFPLRRRATLARAFAEENDERASERGKKAGMVNLISNFDFLLN